MSITVLCVNKISFGKYLGLGFQGGMMSMYLTIKSCLMAFQRICTISHSHQNWKRPPPTPYSHQYLVVSDF